MTGLHAAAAVWFAGHGFAVQAVRHAQAAQDWSLAARLLFDHWFGLLLDGQAATAGELLAGFPAGVTAAAAELTALVAARELNAGAFADAERDLALSPWFVTLQYAGNNATIVNLVSGLAVAGVSSFALASPLLLGVWLIIAGPILSQKHPIADSMFWSDSWAGGLLIVLAAAGLAAVALRRPARR